MASILRQRPIPITDFNHLATQPFLRHSPKQQQQQQQINTAASHPPSTNTSAPPLSLSQPQQPRFIKHLVSADDDLTALALRYSTSVSAIRRYNRKLVFEYLDHVVGEYIDIPVAADYKPLANEECHELESLTLEQLVERYKDWPHTALLPHVNRTKDEVLADLSERRHQRHIRSFIAQAARLNRSMEMPIHFDRTVESDEQEAEFYLDEVGDNVEEAIKLLRADLEFEKAHPEQASQRSRHLTESPSQTAASSISRQLSQQRHNDVSIFKSRPLTGAADPLKAAAIASITPTAAVQLRLAEEKLQRIRALNNIIVKPEEDRGGLLASCFPIQRRRVVRGEDGRGLYEELNESAPQQPLMMEQQVNDPTAGHATSEAKYF